MHAVKSFAVETPRLRQHVRSCGTGETILFVHGNLSSSLFFEELMVSLADTYHCLAVDLRGYGDTQAKPIDATRGAQDWSEDLQSLLEALSIDRAHLMGWSAGAAAIMQLAIDAPDIVASLSLVAPVSPYGFGGCKELDGQACTPDWSGSGGGLVSPELIRLLELGDKTDEVAESPLNLLRTLYVKEPFRFEREAEFLEAMLKQQIGTKAYPGDSLASAHWPFLAPGRWGPINAVSTRYLNLSSIIDLEPKPPILWIRGDSDLIVSDASLCDVAVLGQMGLIPGWSEAIDFPAQPMVAQTRSVLELYKAKGGFYTEIEMSDVGHSPFLEDPETFRHHVTHFLADHS